MEAFFMDTVYNSEESGFLKHFIYLPFNHLQFVRTFTSISNVSKKFQDFLIEQQK